VPGDFVFIDNGPAVQEGGTPLHNACDDFNDDILTTGARHVAELIRIRLPR